MHSSRGRSPLIPLIYVGVVLLLAVVALFARGFSRDVGDGRVAGRYSLLPLFQSRVPEDLTLTWNGFAMHFSRAMTPGLKGYEPAGADTDIVFDGDLRLRLSPGADTGGSITFSPVGASASSASSPLVVPFTVAGVLRDPPAGAALAWVRGGRTYLLTLPAGARTDIAAGTFTLPIAGPAWNAALRVEGVTASARAASPAAPSRTESSRLPDEASMPSEAGLQSSLNVYADAAYQGWSVTRFQPAGSQWQLADGSSGFSEDIGVGLLAESVSRGTWQRVLPLWSGALAVQQQKDPAALSFATSAYVGGIRDFARVQAGRASQRLAQVHALLEKSDNQLLLVAGFVSLLAQEAAPDGLQNAGAFLASRAPSSLDIPSAAGFADALVDYARVTAPQDSMTRLLKEAIERRILPAVRTTNAGVFLETAASRCDLQTSILSGAVLMRAGALADSTLARAVGRGLITSGLSLADAKGVLPATLGLAGGRISTREGSLVPESLYPKLPLDRYVPVTSSLGSQLGAGAWVWTSARIASAAGTPAGAVIDFSYPQGIPYHLMIQGVRPFAQLKLHGIPWHSDPTYFKYSDGWAYDAGSRTLFMKITGKSDREEIDITW
jgi:hypothetical protein